MTFNCAACAEPHSPHHKIHFKKGGHQSNFKKKLMPPGLHTAVLLFTTGGARSKKFNDKPSKGKTPPPCAFVLWACLFTTSGSVVYWSSHTTSKEKYVVTSFCPLCLHDAEILILRDHKLLIYTCPEHGKFAVTNETDKRIRNLHDLAAMSSAHRKILNSLSSDERMRAQEEDVLPALVRTVQFDYES